MGKEAKKITFVEYLRDILLDTEYENMSRQADAEAEGLAEILHENLNFTRSGCGESVKVEMTDNEFEKLTEHLKAFIDEFYDSAVELVDEANEDYRENEQARLEGMRGNY